MGIKSHFPTNIITYNPHEIKKMFQNGTHCGMISRVKKYRLCFSATAPRVACLTNPRENKGIAFLSDEIFREKISGNVSRETNEQNLKK